MSATTPNEAQEDTPKTIVLKLGGAVCLRPETLAALVDGLGAMRAAGLRPVLVHGGGPQLDAALQELGAPVKHKGLRCTSPAAAAIVARELDAVGAGLTAGLAAAGLPVHHVPATAGAVRAEVKRLSDGFDLGRVGTFTGLAGDLFAPPDSIPVVTPVGHDAEGPLNVNADEAAAGIAAALRAERLFLATDVPHVRGADGRPCATLDEAEAAHLILDGTAQGGMIPKLMAALAALEGGVHDVLVTTPEPAALRVVDRPEPGLGTLIRANAEVRILFQENTIQLRAVEA